MKKSALKTKHILETKRGDIGIVIDDLILFNSNTYYPLKYYNEDLTNVYASDLDINKVAWPKHGYILTPSDQKDAIVDYTIWTRPEEPELKEPQYSKAVQERAKKISKARKVLSKLVRDVYKLKNDEVGRISCYSHIDYMSFEDENGEELIQIVDDSDLLDLCHQIEQDKGEPRKEVLKEGWVYAFDEPFSYKSKDNKILCYLSKNKGCLYLALDDEAKIADIYREIDAIREDKATFEMPDEPNLRPGQIKKIRIYEDYTFEFVEETSEPLLKTVDVVDEPKRPEEKEVVARGWVVHDTDTLVAEWRNSKDWYYNIRDIIRQPNCLLSRKKAYNIALDYDEWKPKQIEIYKDGTHKFITDEE